MTAILPPVSEDERLLREWDYEKNKDISPTGLTQGSNVKVWWRCEKGHSWETAPNHRHRGSNCPYCANKKVLAGYNDLATTFPGLVNEWDYEKNRDLTPQECTMKSHKNVWWKCKKGHSWKAIISNRSKGHACPYCVGQWVIPGENDLLTLNPELAGEWDYEKNGTLTPEDVKVSSGKSVWWKCSEGHSWKSMVYARKYNGCPYCAGRKVISGINDLQTLAPLLAAEWDDDKNGELKPDGVSIQSNRTVWWQCSKGHSWKASVCERQRGNSCPKCNGRIRMKTHFIS